MSLSGSLEDVSVADVLQFVHLGGRSGTLRVSCGAARAEIGFHRGRIISARGPGSQRLGELLVQDGSIARKDLEAALRNQRRSHPPPPLGQVLVQMGALTQARLLEAAERHVERSIYEVVTWTHGSFDFVLDELKPVDDLAVSPGDILPDIHVNTQMVLLEAARIFDERGKAPAERKARPRPPEAEGAGPRAEAGASPDAAPDAAGGDGEPPRTPAPGTTPPATAPRAAPTRFRLQILSEDRALAGELGRLLAPLQALVVAVAARDAGSPLPGEPAPVVVVDLKPGRPAVELLASLKRIRPHAIAVAVIDAPAEAAAAYAAGAVAAVPRDAASVAACVESVVRHRREAATDQAVRDGLKAGFAKLHRLLGEFRSGLVTATISLNLMNIISESVERAVLFLVRRSDLIVLGAFGHAVDGKPLAERSQGIKIDLGSSGILGESIRDGRSRTMPFDPARLPAPLVALIGPPASSQCAVFPVLGGRKVVATVYADNGRKNRPIDELDFLDLATSQVGMAYENELLRRQLGEPAFAADRRAGHPPGAPEARIPS